MPSAQGVKHTLIGLNNTPPAQASVLSGMAMGLVLGSLHGEKRAHPPHFGPDVAFWVGRPSTSGRYIVGFGVIGGAQYAAEVLWEQYKVQ